MTRYDYTTSVEAETKEQADQVMDERLGCDEDYGFDYVVYYRELADPAGPGRGFAERAK